MRRNESTMGASIAVLTRRPADTIGACAFLAAAIAIGINALYLQPGPHPAPFFAVKSNARAQDQTASIVPMLPRPRPGEKVDQTKTLTARTRTEIVSDIQRELLRRGFYDGPIDGVHGPKTDSAIRDFEQAAGLKSGGEPSEDLLKTITRSNAKINPPPATASAAQPVRNDPLADLIAPPQKRVIAVQRALSDYGYAQLKPTGTIGADTRAAIEKFERERKLPVTGMVSDRLMRELSAMTGRPLE